MIERQENVPSGNTFWERPLTKPLTIIVTVAVIAILFKFVFNPCAAENQGMYDTIFATLFFGTIITLLFASLFNLYYLIMYRRAGHLLSFPAKQLTIIGMILFYLMFLFSFTTWFTCS